MATNSPDSAIGLTTDEIEQLKAADLRIKELHKELDKAESAGLDMSETRDTLNEAERLRQGMLNVYGKTPLRRRG